MYNYVGVYIESRVDNDGAYVDEDDFWMELKSYGINPEQVIDSYADADRDGYRVTVRLLGPLPKGADQIQEVISDEEFDQAVNNLGSWPDEAHQYPR